jgi:hypothetical protein
MQGSDAEAAVLGGTNIHVKFGHGVDPYFDLPMPESPKGWQKLWFFFRNYVAALLVMFMGNRPIPQPNWGHRVAKKKLQKLQSLREVIQQL